MSINLIIPSPSEQSQTSNLLPNAEQVKTTSTEGSFIFDNAMLGVSRDSINISNTALIHAENKVHVADVSNQIKIYDTDDARKAVSSIISYFQNNGTILLDSLNAPTTRSVLSVIRAI